jgi:hypothetical protein
VCPFSPRERAITSNLCNFGLPITNGSNFRVSKCRSGRRNGNSTLTLTKPAARCASCGGGAPVSRRLVDSFCLSVENRPYMSPNRSTRSTGKEGAPTPHRTTSPKIDTVLLLCKQRLPPSQTKKITSKGYCLQLLYYWNLQHRNLSLYNC